MENVEGYLYRKEDSNSWSSTISSAFNTDDSLYVITYDGRADGIWLASPGGSEKSLSNVYHLDDGSLDSNVCSNSDYSRGFRPLICLKSNVELQEQSENKYAIK